MTKSFIKYRPRIRFLSSFIILFWITLCAKLFSVQVFDGKTHQKTLIAQSQRQEKLPAERGNIFDRNGDALTRNIAHYTISVNPQKISDKIALASVISTLTKKSKKNYLKKLNSKKKFEFLERNIRLSQSNIELVKKYEGLNIKKSYRRSYPHGPVVSQILGYNDTDGRGISGLEKDYDNILSGKSGVAIKTKGWKGKFQSRSGLPFTAPIDGSDIILTLDLNYQSILQEELIKRVHETEAKSAMGIIMNPQSGEIIAMSSVPTFDNNNFSKYSISHHHSKVLTDQFEPGSTFKIVAATASLAEDKISLNQEFSCENGKFDYFGTIIKDHEPYEQLNISQIIKHSSNIGIIKIAEQVGSSSIYKYAKLFGFGTPTNFDMAGESTGKIKPEKEWSRISIGQISMGHEVAVNTLQLAVAFSAIANNGFLVKPYIINKIKKSNKKLDKKTISKVKRKISSEDKIIKIKDMLRQVVLNGTGTEADILGWEVAGKTGTAQKYIDGKYSNEHFISNFVGFFPASKPEILSVIVLDEPKSPMHWGGTGAAVAFKRVMKRIINMDDSISPPKKQQRQKETKHLSFSDLEMNLISNQIPSALSTKNFQKKIKVPNVIGKSLKKAIRILSDAGLKFKVNGSGQVVDQFPKPGKLSKNDKLCILTLK